MKLKMKKYILFLMIIFTAILLYPYNIYAQYREETNIDNIDESKYPGIKERLKDMKSRHPNWTFTIFYTGLNWDDVVYNETSAYHGRSLIQNRSGAWRCPICGDKVLDGTNWYCASPAAVSFYLDPRNFLYDNEMFQFETLSYREGSYTKEGVEKILDGTFMHETSISSYYNNSNYTSSTFADIILEAGREANVSPYHIASRIKQEVTKNGGPSDSVTGTYPGYEGYYNFFNIGATSGEGAVARGLRYAQSKGWDSPEKSIKDGANTVGANYISIGQDTLYLEKFDVDDRDGLYYHQYQQNIEAPMNEGRRIYNAYNSMGVIDEGFNFIIPVYENMPQVVCAKPNENFYIVTEDVEVNKDGIMVRTENNTWASAVQYVNRGDRILRIEKGGTYSDGFIWDKVVLSNGDIGYIETDYLNKIDDIVTCNDSMYATSNVNLRNGPGLNSTTVIRTLAAGEEFIRIESGKYNLDGYTWDRIRLSDGTQGYVASNYIDMVNSGSTSDEEIVRVIANEPLALREQPTTSSRKITSFPKGTLLTRIEKNVAQADGLEWDKVRTADNKEGYVASKYLEHVSGGEEETPPDEPSVEPSSDKHYYWVDEGNKIINCSPDVSIQDIQNQNSGVDVTGKNNENQEISDVNSSIGTGSKVNVGDKEYSIVKYGDIDGNGSIDARDSLRILKYVVGEYNLDEKVYFYAADVSKDNSADARDSLRILKYVVGEYDIKA